MYYKTQYNSFYYVEHILILSLLSRAFPFHSIPVLCSTLLKMSLLRSASLHFSLMGQSPHFWKTVPWLDSFCCSLEILCTMLFISASFYRIFHIVRSSQGEIGVRGPWRRWHSLSEGGQGCKSGLLWNTENSNLRSWSQQPNTLYGQIQPVNKDLKAWPASGKGSSRIFKDASSLDF